MQQNTVELIASSAEALGVEIRVEDDYSGRGMYGKTTHAVVYSSLGDLLACCADAAMTATAEGEHEEVVAAFIRDLKQIRTDNMGRDMIAY